MAADSDGTLTAVVICEGDLHDPEFPGKLKNLLGKLNSLIEQPKSKKLKINKVEPWNSVRVTLSIPKEAAARLRALAAEGNSALRELGILSVQLEGDTVISLRLDGREIVLRTSDNASAQDSASGLNDLSRILTNNPQTPQVAAVASTSTNSVNAPNVYSKSSSIVVDNQMPGTSKSSSNTIHMNGPLIENITNNNNNNSNNMNISTNSNNSKMIFKSPNTVCPMDGKLPVHVPNVVESCEYPFESMTQARVIQRRENTLGISAAITPASVASPLQHPPATQQHTTHFIAPQSPHTSQLQAPPPYPSINSNNNNSNLINVKASTSPHPQQSTVSAGGVNSSGIPSMGTSNVVSSGGSGSINTSGGNIANSSPLLVNLLQNEGGVAVSAANVNSSTVNKVLKSNHELLLMSVGNSNNIGGTAPVSSITHSSSLNTVNTLQHPNGNNLIVSGSEIVENELQVTNTLRTNINKCNNKQQIIQQQQQQTFVGANNNNNQTSIVVNSVVGNNNLNSGSSSNSLINVSPSIVTPPLSVPLLNNSNNNNNNLKMQSRFVGPGMTATATVAQLHHVQQPAIRNTLVSGVPITAVVTATNSQSQQQQQTQQLQSQHSLNSRFPMQPQQQQPHSIPQFRHPVGIPQQQLLQHPPQNVQMLLSNNSNVPTPSTSGIVATNQMQQQQQQQSQSQQPNAAFNRWQLKPMDSATKSSYQEFTRYQMQYNQQQQQMQQQQMQSFSNTNQQHLSQQQQQQLPHHQQMNVSASSSGLQSQSQPILNSGNNKNSGTIDPLGFGSLADFADLTKNDLDSLLPTLNAHELDSAALDEILDPKDLDIDLIEKTLSTSTTNSTSSHQGQQQQHQIPHHFNHQHHRKIDNLTSSGKQRQYLINPLTGDLEPMPSEESSSENEADELAKATAAAFNEFNSEMSNSLYSDDENSCSTSFSKMTSDQSDTEKSNMSDVSITTKTLNSKISRSKKEKIKEPSQKLTNKLNKMATKEKLNSATGKMNQLATGLPNIFIDKVQTTIKTKSKNKETKSAKSKLINLQDIHSNNILDVNNIGLIVNNNVGLNNVCPEKIKLRLKLEKTEEYKVDFINSINKKVQSSPSATPVMSSLGSTSANNKSATFTPISATSVTSPASSSPSQTNLSVSHKQIPNVPQQSSNSLSSQSPAGEELRVPPLHISLRGRNSVVIKNSKKDRKKSQASGIASTDNTDVKKVNRKNHIAASLTNTTKTEVKNSSYINDSALNARLKTLDDNSSSNSSSSSSSSSSTSTSSSSFSSISVSSANKSMLSLSSSSSTNYGTMLSSSTSSTITPMVSNSTPASASVTGSSQQNYKVKSNKQQFSTSINTEDLNKNINEQQTSLLILNNHENTINITRKLPDHLFENGGDSIKRNSNEITHNPNGLNCPEKKRRLSTAAAVVVSTANSALINTSAITTPGILSQNTGSTTMTNSTILYRRDSAASGLNDYERHNQYLSNITIGSTNVGTLPQHSSLSTTKNLKNLTSINNTNTNNNCLIHSFNKVQKTITKTNAKQQQQQQQQQQPLHPQQQQLQQNQPQIKTNKVNMNETITQTKLITNLPQDNNDAVSDENFKQMLLLEKKQSVPPSPQQQQQHQHNIEQQETLLQTKIIAKDGDINMKAETALSISSSTTPQTTAISNNIMIKTTTTTASSSSSLSSSSSSSSSSTSSTSSSSSSVTSSVSSNNSTPESNSMMTQGSVRSSPSSQAQGEDSGIESMDALSEKSPHQSSHSPQCNDSNNKLSSLTESQKDNTNNNNSNINNNNSNKSNINISKPVNNIIVDEEYIDIEANLAKMEGIITCDTNSTKQKLNGDHSAIQLQHQTHLQLEQQSSPQSQPQQQQSSQPHHNHQHKNNQSQQQQQPTTQQHRHHLHNHHNNLEHKVQLENDSDTVILKNSSTIKELLLLDNKLDDDKNAINILTKDFNEKKELLAIKSEEMEADDLDKFDDFCNDVDVKEEKELLPLRVTPALYTYSRDYDATAKQLKSSSDTIENTLTTDEIKCDHLQQLSIEIPQHHETENRVRTRASSKLESPLEPPKQSPSDSPASISKVNTKLTANTMERLSPKTVKAGKRKRQESESSTQSSVSDDTPGKVKKIRTKSSTPTINCNSSESSTSTTSSSSSSGCVATLITASSLGNIKSNQKKIESPSTTNVAVTSLQSNKSSNSSVKSSCSSGSVGGGKKIEDSSDSDEPLIEVAGKVRNSKLTKSNLALVAAVSSSSATSSTSTTPIPSPTSTTPSLVNFPTNSQQMSESEKVLRNHKVINLTTGSVSSVASSALSTASSTKSSSPSPVTVSGKNGPKVQNTEEKISTRRSVRMTTSALATNALNKINKTVSSVMVNMAEAKMNHTNLTKTLTVGGVAVDSTEARRKTRSAGLDNPSEGRRRRGSRDSK